MTIRAVMGIILGEAYPQVWSDSAAMCFKCVDKLNNYDEAYTKMQIMEQEFKSMLGVNVMVNMENIDDNVAAAENKEVDDVDKMDVDKPLAEVSNDSLVVDIVQSADPDVSIEKENPTDEPASDTVSSTKKKSEFYCKACKKSFRKLQGLNVKMKFCIYQWNGTYLSFSIYLHSYTNSIFILNLSDTNARHVTESIEGCMTLR